LAGITAMVAILFIIVIALAGLGIAVVNALADSPWGTFTIFLTIPIALIVGQYLHRSKAAYAIRNGSIAGALMVLGAVVAGRFIPGTALGVLFTMSKPQITIAIAIYGFIASVLPVWMLLCPRDYLSSYMKLGTIPATTTPSTFRPSSSPSSDCRPSICSTSRRWSAKRWSAAPAARCRWRSVSRRSFPASPSSAD